MKNTLKGGEFIKYGKSVVLKLRLSNKKRIRKEKLEEIEFMIAINKQIEKNKNEKNLELD